MAFLVQGTARKGLVVRDGKRPKRGPGKGSETWPSSDYEDNDACLPFAKIQFEKPRLKCFLEFSINILFLKSFNKTRVYLTKCGGHG